ARAGGATASAAARKDNEKSQGWRTGCGRELRACAARARLDRSSGLRVLRRAADPLDQRVDELPVEDRGRAPVLQRRRPRERAGQDLLDVPKALEHPNLIEAARDGLADRAGRAFEER